MRVAFAITFILSCLLTPSYLPAREEFPPLSGARVKGFWLTVSKDGACTGTVTSDVAGINCGSGDDCKRRIREGTIVHLTAIPDGGCSFGGWTGDGAGITDRTVIVSQTRAVTATFSSGGGSPIMTEDFQSVTDDTTSALDAFMTARGWDWNGDAFCGASGTHESCILNQAGPSSSQSMRLTLKASPNQETAFPRYFISPVTEIYTRLYVKFSSSYDFRTGFNDAQKVAYHESKPGDPDYWRTQLGVATWKGQSDRTIGEFFLDYWKHFQEVHHNQGGDPIVINRNTWYKVEFHTKMSSSEGSPDGVMEFWIDGVLSGRATGVIPNYTGQGPSQGGTFTTNQINTCWLTAFYGGADETHSEQYIWYDDIVCDDARIN